MKTKHYVYQYSVEGEPVYIGIGTEDGGEFARARDVRHHKEVIEAYTTSQVKIEVIARRLTKPSAMTIEATLIHEYKVKFALLNVAQPASGTKKRYRRLRLTPRKAVKIGRTLSVWEKEHARIKRREYNKAYAKTERGKAARKRVDDKYNALPDYKAAITGRSRWRHKLAGAQTSEERRLAKQKVLEYERRLEEAKSKLVDA
jgi:hypothetical protein